MLIANISQLLLLLLLINPKVENRTLKRHKSIGVFVVYIDTGSSMPISPSESRDLANENRNILVSHIVYKQVHSV
jgi:hypothetical protein